MNPGRSQNDNVSGEAKLSWTRDTVKSVGNLINWGGSGNWSGLTLRAFSSNQLPRASVARAASIRDNSLSSLSRRNTLTVSATNCLPRIAWIMATPCDEACRSDCRSHN
jgi:hypothetical protein